MPHSAVHTYIASMWEYPPPSPGNSTDCQEMCFLLAAADGDNFLIRNGCASLALTGGSDNLLRFIHKIRIPTLSWIQTPSIVEVEPGEKTKTFTREPRIFFL